MLEEGVEVARGAAEAEAGGAADGEAATELRTGVNGLTEAEVRLMSVEVRAAKGSNGFSTDAAEVGALEARGPREEKERYARGKGSVTLCEGNERLLRSTACWTDCTHVFPLLRVTYPWDKKVA